MWRRIGVPLAIVVLLALAVLMLPRGYNTDLSKIGNGKYAVVQTFDKNTVQSEELMDTVNTVRKEFEPRGVEFLVADMGTERGRRFTQSHGVSSATLLIFAPDGRLLRTLTEKQDSASLRRAIDQAMGDK